MEGAKTAYHVIASGAGRATSGPWTTMAIGWLLLG